MSSAGTAVSGKATYRALPWVWYKKPVAKHTGIALQVRAVWMLLASAFKDEWTIDDYPIRISFQPGSELQQSSRLKTIPWTASVINWPSISGYGNTRNEALDVLRKNFDRFKARNSKLPRPGTKVPIEFAASRRVGQHSELAKDFFKRVLEVDWAWISDESSLWDFHGDETNDELVGKIHRIYGVDVSDISDGNLADIFDRITKSGPTTVPSPD